MRLWIPFAAGAGALLTIASIVGADWDLPPVETVGVGYPGSGMVLVQDVEESAALAAANVPPPSPYTPDPEGERASEFYENVQVLGDLSVDEFNHLMASITEWVSPEQGCAYCHDIENLASDTVYTKVVARRMIQMNQTVNADWTDHVGQAGVTCYTCHRGNPVPENAWSTGAPEPAPAGGMAGYTGSQNRVAEVTAYSSLPHEALEAYLLEDRPIRVHSSTALPTGENQADIKDTEWTWALMMHMSRGLGVNCTACHNSRAFNDWDESPPQRVTAWHGIRMVREINNAYLTGLAPVFPDNRLGPEGDVLKANCATCHNGQLKPLNGVSMLEDYVNSLTRKISIEVPDFESYRPGETELLAPGSTSDAGPARPAASSYAAAE